MEQTEGDVNGLPTAELMARLRANLTGIVEQQVELAKAEARQSARRGAVAGGLLGAGGLFLHTTLVALVVAVVLAIGPQWTPVSVALIVAAVFAVAGILALLVGRSLLPTDPMARTRQVLKEDVEWARTQTISRGK